MDLKRKKEKKKKGKKKKKEKKKKDNMQFVIDRKKKIFCNKNVVYIVCVSFKCYNSKKKT